jgi:subtilisin family serine protease
MSLGGGYSRALNRMISNIIKKSDTFYITVAAGNENQDACNVSPASVKEIITVMASDKTDNRAYFSNWGECADIYAPGVNIESTTPNGQTAVYSGTSMACPATVGVLNHLIDLYPEANMKDLKHVLLKTATNGTIRRSPLDTPNMFVYLNRNGEL